MTPTQIFPGASGALMAASSTSKSESNNSGFEALVSSQNSKAHMQSKTSQQDENIDDPAAEEGQQVQEQEIVDAEVDADMDANLEAAPDGAVNKVVNTGTDANARAEEFAPQELQAVDLTNKVDTQIEETSVPSEGSSRANMKDTESLAASVVDVLPKSKDAQETKEVISESKLSSDDRITQVAEKDKVASTAVKPTQDPELKDDIVAKSDDITEAEDVDAAAVAQPQVPISAKSLTIIGEFSKTRPISMSPSQAAGKRDQTALKSGAVDLDIDSLEIRQASAEKDAESLLDPQKMPAKIVTAEPGTRVISSVSDDKTAIQLKSISEIPLTAEKTGAGVNAEIEASADTPDLDVKMTQGDSVAAKLKSSVSEVISRPETAQVQRAEAPIEGIRIADATVDDVSRAEPSRQPAKSPIVQNLLNHVRQINVEPGTITIRLKPHGMGLVEFDVAADPDGRMEVSIRAKNPMVLDALRVERHAIADLLVQQGANIKQDGLSFNLFSQSGKDGNGTGKDTPQSGQAGGIDSADDDEAVLSNTSQQDISSDGSVTNIVI